MLLIFLWLAVDLMHKLYGGGSKHLQIVLSPVPYKILHPIIKNVGRVNQDLTCKMFVEWVQRQYGTAIDEGDSRIGFSRLHHQKGVYFNRRERDDVVAYISFFSDNGRIR